MIKDKEHKTPRLNDEVMKLVPLIKNEIKVHKTGAAEVEHSDVYYTTLPDDLPAETVDRLSQHNTNFIAAGAFAFSELGIEAMKDNKSLDKTSVEIKMAGKDTVSYTLDRKREYTNSLGNGETVESYGVLTTSYNVRGAKNSSGQLKIARTLVSELAMAALK